MAEEISSLTLKMDTQSVNEASNDLDKFSKKAAEAASATDDLTAAKKRASNMTAEELKDFERVYQNAVKGAKATRVAAEEERKFTAARKQLLDSSDKLYVRFQNQILSLRNINTASKELERVRNSLTESYKNGQIDVNNYSQLLSNIAIKSKEVTTAESIATQAKTNFLNKLKEQVAVQNMTKEQLLRYKAAQLGVSSSADIYIKKLTQAQTTTQALGKGAGVTRQQLTTMMAQLSRGDISGFKNSLMFASSRSGGIGNALKSIMSSISPVQIGLTGLVTGGIALAKAYYEGSQELSNFNKTIVMTGNYAGVTGSQVATMAKRIGSEVGTVSDAANALVLALSTNKFKGEGLELVAKTAVNLQQTIGKSVSETIEEFKKLADDPVKASEELNNQYGYLTASVYQQITALQKQGDTLGAQELATKAYASAMDEKTTQIKANLGTLERAWAAVAGTAKAAWDAMMNAGRENTLDEQIQQVQDKIEGRKRGLAAFGEWTISQDNQYIELNKELDALKNQKVAEEGKAAATAQTVEINKKAIDGEKVLSGWIEKGRTAAEKRVEATKKLQEAIQANRVAYEADLKLPEDKRGGVKLFTSTDITKARDAINKELADKNSGGGGTSTTNLLQSSLQHEISLKNQLQALREQSLTVTTITGERKKYFDLQAQIQTLESVGDKSKLSAQEKYVLANKESLLTQYAKNAAIGDEISQYETATKALRKMQEYSTKVASEAATNQVTFGMTSKNVGRYNQMSDLDAQRDIALKGTSNPTEITKVTEEYNKAKLALQSSWQQEDINQGDWVTGLKLGLEQYAETSQNVFSASTSFAQQSMSSLSSMMTTLVTTGKANFKDFAKSILTNLVDIINKLIIAQTIQTALGWMGNKALAQQQVSTLVSSSGLFSDGGFTGTGDKYTPAGVVHKGEFVFTKAATQRLGINNLYGLMDRAERGYASGGYVGGGSAKAFLSQTAATRGYANGGYVDGGFVTPAAFNQLSNNSSAINVTANVVINMPSDDNKSSNSSNSNLQSATGQLKAIIKQEVSETFKKSVSPGGDMYNVMKAMR